jgi:1-acyl-sn-glycerol-3-phosphate acyltransferase
MCIYPEGTRNRTNHTLKPFFDGAFKLAIDAKKEIIPCIIKGTKQAMPIDKSFYLMPQTLHLYFLPPVASDNISAKELNKKIYTMMSNACIEKGV